MAIVIEDNGDLLDITVSGEKHSLPKNSIELNVWDGHVLIWSFMRERYRLPYADVTTPSCASAELLRDAIADLINVPDATKITDGAGVVNTKQLGTAITSSDVGLVTNSVIHGVTTGGGGAYVDVKVKPSGALVVSDDDVLTQLETLNSLVPSAYDYISLSYSGSNVTGVVYKSGGSSGTIVSTLTIVYSGSNITSVTKT